MHIRLVAQVAFPSLMLSIVLFASCGYGKADCVPECGTRNCGPDPKCGVSCGECGAGMYCEIGKCTSPDCVLDTSSTRNTDPDWKLESAAWPSEGYICPRGDVDYYWFETTDADTTADIELYNKVSMTPVDLCYTLFPLQEGDPSIGGACDHDGLDGITEIYASHYLPDAGIYLLEIYDEGRDDEDPRFRNRYYLSIVISVE